MDLLLLDKNFEVCGVIDDFSSLVWNRKYYECGNFSLQTNLNDLEKFENAKYLFCKDFEETGVFETLEYKHTQKGIEILRTGRFLESLLSQRIIASTYKFTNKTTEKIAFSLVDSEAISCIASRVIDKLVLGNEAGLGTARTMQVTWKNLMEKIYEICKEDELSIRLKYDLANDKIVFNVWQGLNRLDTQSVNNPVIFSRNFENILEDEYSTDSTQYCNYIYVEGQKGDDENPTRVEVIIDDVKEGEDRRELYVDARDLQQEEGVTDAEYLEQLRERGLEKKAEVNKVETSTFIIDPYSNVKYKEDFDLGDKVVYKNEDLNLIIENRIVEVTEAYEDGNTTIELTFGEDYNIKKGELL